MHLVMHLVFVVLAALVTLMVWLTCWVSKLHPQTHEFLPLSLHKKWCVMPTTRGTDGAIRTLVAWCPDWPITAAIQSGEASASDPVAIIRANRVVAASRAARAMGVARAMRRRDAQSRCPDIALVTDDPGRDARLFEPIVSALDPFTPRIEIVRAGLCQFPTRGPSRYFGGDEALADRMRAAVLAVLAESVSLDETDVASCNALVRIGIADGPFAAAFAARSITPIVSPGESAAFLAPYALRALIAVEGGRAVAKAARSSKRAQSSAATDAETLALIDTVDLLERLGIKTLGALAALDSADVLARFGSTGLRAWRLASGRDERMPNTRQPPPDLTVEVELDPPVERIDTAAFYAKALAEEFTDRLARLGLACTRISIEAETERGETLQRLWRHERAGAAGGLNAAGLADRMRWQLDGWLQRMALAERDLQREAASDFNRDASTAIVPRSEWLTGGLVRLRLAPDEVIPDEGRQLGLWGGVSAADERAARAFARVQALLGPQAVCSAVPVGGRRPTDTITFIPWGDQREVGKTSTTTKSKKPIDTLIVDRKVKGDSIAPWPGRLPSPLPTTTYAFPQAVSVLDGAQRPVTVSGRGDISAPPVFFRIHRVERIASWAGPWPLEERWWDLHAARRQARLQIVVASTAGADSRLSDADATVERAYLVVLEGGQWWLEASYC
jgi:protein ImuB